MDDKSCLSKIIDHDGDCSIWASERICERCPLSRLVRRHSGGYLSCTEAVGAIELSRQDADKRFFFIAACLLFDMNVEDLLLEWYDTK